MLKRAIETEPCTLQARTVGRHGRTVNVSRQPRERLLCEECEQRFSRWERDAAYLAFRKDGTCGLFEEIGYESPVHSLPSERDARFLPLEGMVDLAPLARCGASVIWRFAVAAEHGRGVKLGKYAEPLRLWLLQDEPVLPPTFSLGIAFFDQSPSVTDGIHRATFMATSRRRTECRTWVHVFVGGGIYFQLAAGRHIPEALLVGAWDTVEGGQVTLAPANAIQLVAEGHEMVLRASGR